MPGLILKTLNEAALYLKDCEDLDEFEQGTTSLLGGMVESEIATDLTIYRVLGDLEENEDGVMEDPEDESEDVWPAQVF